MKVSEFIDMTVLDKEAHEVGKVAEIAVKLKKCLVDKIFISTGGALNKKYFAVAEGDIANIGDYVQLKLDKYGIEQRVHVDKLTDFLPKGNHFKDLVGKKVLSQEGIEVGKISDMLIDPKGCLIHNIVISAGTALNKKQFLVSDEDIKSIGDFIILKLTKEEVEG